MKCNHCDHEINTDEPYVEVETDPKEHYHVECFYEVYEPQEETAEA